MKIVDGFRLRELMGQAIIIGEGVNQVDFNKLVTLNESAAYLWRSVDGKDFEVETLAALLIEKYGIDEELAMKDASALASQWKEIGLVE